ncbi:unnamed protein product [Dovyalis caffra]|uniref:LysM domain receptor-like kinase 3 n=1 Tax=Dovyalis caffra TaxID=77055 RepID=A0AAV1SNC4_9ROSI|nr:unnamed protein product [Dovyalis caffra]
MACNVSLRDSCPASLYYVPNTMRSLDETASLFNVENDVVNRTIDGFLIMINCSCLAEHRFFTWHMDYKVQKGDTWKSISSQFGLFVVAMPEMVLIPSVIVTLDVLCGCSKNADVVTYKVQNGDTLYTICSRFKANATKTATLNGLENPEIIHEGDILFIPTPAKAGSNNLTAIDGHNEDIKTQKASKARIRIVVGAISAADVAIKQMKDTKSKEFFSELNILCKVHHTNLIELIGYAAGGESLFLVYELAQNGALSDHLHRPALRGYKPLPWTTRVQIALDAAKGLEYIHEHTKPYYVHRDVKPSNILLDSNFRAKIADFGLVKLLEYSPDAGGAAASRIVGTFGYLAPESLSKDASPENDQLSEHRSLVQYMLSALNDNQDSFDQLAKCVDPNLTSYNKDSLCQMALLSKDCVDDNWKQRPDMSRVVLRLSHILSSSKESEER